MIPFAVGVLAVDHLGLLRVEHQSTLSEPLIENPTQFQGFAFAAAMTDDVIGIPLKRNAGEASVKPHVEHVVQE
jgi:hypothetical protein